MAGRLTRTQTKTAKLAHRNRDWTCPQFQTYLNLLNMEGEEKLMEEVEKLEGKMQPRLRRRRSGNLLVLPLLGRTCTTSMTVRDSIDLSSSSSALCNNTSGSRGSAARTSTDDDLDNDLDHHRAPRRSSSSTSSCKLPTLSAKSTSLVSSNMNKVSALSERKPSISKGSAENKSYDASKECTSMNQRGSQHSVKWHSSVEEQHQETEGTNKAKVKRKKGRTTKRRKRKSKSPSPEELEQRRWLFTDDPSPVRLYVSHHEVPETRYVEGIVDEKGRPLLPLSRQHILRGMIYDSDTKSLYPPLPSAEAKLGSTLRNCLLFPRLRREGSMVKAAKARKRSSVFVTEQKSQVLPPTVTQEF